MRSKTDASHVELYVDGESGRMKDKIQTVLVGAAVVIVSVSASILAVDRLTDQTMERAMELGKLELKIKEQGQNLEKTRKDLENQNVEIANQNESLRIARTKIDTLLMEATGAETGREASKRLEQIRTLADAIGSNDNVDQLLGLRSRVDALTNEKHRVCSSDIIEYGRAKSCREHNDWIPRASCPPGQFIRSINIVAKHVADGWACGFQIKCCSSVGILPSTQAAN